MVWIYFLFYIGAGYPSWYYPYIIATLLDFVPSECGGTGGDGGSSSLSLLNLLDSSNGLGFTGGTGGSSYGYANGQYLIYPGQQSYAQPGRLVLPTVNTLTVIVERFVMESQQ